MMDSGRFPFIQIQPPGVSPSPIQSSDSNWKIRSTDVRNTRAIFNARTVEGTNRPVSMALMVCRLTPVASANACWVMRSSARSARILFFISQRFFESPHFHLIDHQEDQQHGEDIPYHHIQIIESVKTEGRHNDKCRIQI